MIILRRTLIIIFAILLCFAIWFVGPIIYVGKYTPFGSVWIRVLLITIVLILVFWPIAVIIISFLLQYFLRPFKRKPKPKKELDIVTSRFYDTIATLEASSMDSKQTWWQRLFFKLSKPYLEDRPWYLFLGARTVGKTSLIYNSGEQFLYSEHYGFGKTANIGPTNEYNAWISKRAVYFDTSEEWLKLDGQKEESANHVNKFFKLIKRYRPNSGLDGIVLCISANWLKNASLNEIKSFADSLRVRLLEITKRLSEDLPVYLFITKIDLLPGSKDFMFLFNEEIINKGIGLSAPPIKINGRDENYFTVFSERYDNWLKKLTDYLLEILHDSLTDTNREHLFHFVETIGSLKNPLFSIVEQIFPNYPTGYGGYLHDVWFGSILALRIDDSDDDLKLFGRLYYPALTRVVNSRGVLRNLTAAKKHSINKRNTFLYAAIGLFVLISIALLSWHFQREADYISYVKEGFKETKRIVQEVPVDNKVSGELRYGYTQLSYINNELASSKYSWSWHNPYVEHIFVNKTIDRTYHKHLLKFFWPAVTNYVTNQLAENIRDDSNEVYDTLRIYQMFAKPEYRSSVDLVNWFMKHWDDFAANSYTNEDKKIFSFHLRRLFDDEFPDGNPTFKANPTLVHMAILKASHVTMTKRVIDKIKQIPIPANIIPISLVTAAGSNASLMLRHKDNKSVVEPSIPAFYTRAAYHDIFLDNLDKVSEQIIDELSWVLEDNSQKNSPKSTKIGFKQRFKDDVIKYYLIDYTSEWKKFINNITIRPIKNLEDSAFLAKQLSDPSSPIVNFIRFTYQEINLTGSGDSRSGNWFERTTARLGQKRREVIGEISGERLKFRLTPERLVEDQFKALITIGERLNATDDLNGNPVSKLFDDVYNLIYPLSLIVRDDPSAPAQQESVYNQIKGRAVVQPEPLQSILLDLIKLSQTQAIEVIQKNLNSKIEDMFTRVCQSTVKSKYPFNRNASSEVSLADFSRMFAPEGSLEQFFKKNNIDQLVRNRESQKSIVTEKMINAYNNTKTIRDTFFLGGSNSVGFSLDIKPISLSSNVFQADINIDGQEIKYSHGYPTNTSITWPGPNKNNIIRVVFQTNNGEIKIKTFEGPWALFKLYDSAKVIKSGPNYKIISLVTEKKYSIDLEIRSNMENFPLWSNAIRNFSCP